MVKIRFASSLLNLTNTKETSFIVEDTTLKFVLDQLITKFGSSFESRIMDNGAIRRFVNIYLNGEDIRYLEGLDTKIKDKDEISILPAVSRGDNPAVSGGEGGSDGYTKDLKNMLCIKCKSKTFEIKSTHTDNLYIICANCGGIISPLNPDMSISGFVQFWKIGLRT